MLLIRIRTNKDIKGIKIGSEEIKLTSYADDLTNFLRDSRSLIVLFQELEQFSRYSGLRCNKEKTEAMKHGLCNIDQGNDIKIVEFMKVTGIYFSFDRDIMIAKNFEDIRKKISNSLNVWKARGITLLGRIQTVKTFAYSQLRFLTNFVEPPVDLMNDIRTLISAFIWKNDQGRGKIKKETAIADFDQGGLRIPDADLILECQKIREKFQKGK